MDTVFNPFVRFAGQIAFDHMTDQVRQAPDCRIFYFHAGRGTLTLCRRVHSLLPGSLIYIPAHTPYRFTNTSKVQLTAINFDFTQTRTDRTIPYPSNRANSEETNRDAIHPDLTVPLVIDDWNAAQRTMMQLSRLLTEMPPYYRDRASATLKLFLIDLIQNSTATGADTAQTVITYLRRHCREPLSNTELAHRLNYHPVHLNRLVKQATGMGCRAYIISCRLSEAKQMLLSTEASVTEIAEACGFASASHLARLMKKEEGISPLAFRRNVMRDIV